MMDSLCIETSTQIALQALIAQDRSLEQVSEIIRLILEEFQVLLNIIRILRYRFRTSETK